MAMVPSLLPLRRARPDHATVVPTLDRRKTPFPRFAPQLCWLPRLLLF